MFTRRKILLALLEANGEELSKIDMEKLLFVFCDESRQNHYDFFPYKYGCFSFLSYQDKRVLTQQGYLADVDNFKLKKNENYLGSLESDERSRIEAFINRTKKLRGKSLIRHVYVNHPYYAIRSEIKKNVLQPRELQAVEQAANRETSICLMTIGYEGSTIDAYINKLIRNNVNLIVDVRRNPLSMKYGFSKTRLQNYLERAGIRYEHIPALGIESSQRKNLETEKDYKALFKRYATKSLPDRKEELHRIENLVMEHKRVALTCFEADHHSCHRHKITERLQSNKQWNIPIKHI